MERILLAAGAPLAERSLSMTPTAPVMPMFTGRSSAATAPARSAGGLRDDVTLLLPLAYHLVVAALLVVARYPVWRIAVVLVAGAALKGGCHLARARARSLCVNSTAEVYARFALFSQSTLLVTAGVTVAVTGGARSPLLPTLLAPYFATVVAQPRRAPGGRRRRARPAGEQGHHGRGGSHRERTLSKRRAGGEEDSLHGLRLTGSSSAGRPMPNRARRPARRSLEP